MASTWLAGVCPQEEETTAIVNQVVKSLVAKNEAAKHRAREAHRNKSPEEQTMAWLEFSRIHRAEVERFEDAGQGWSPSDEYLKVMEEFRGWDPVPVEEKVMQKRQKEETAKENETKAWLWNWALKERQEEIWLLALELGIEDQGNPKKKRRILPGEDHDTDQSIRDRNICHWNMLLDRARLLRQMPPPPKEPPPPLPPPRPPRDPPPQGLSEEIHRARQDELVVRRQGEELRRWMNVHWARVMQVCKQILT